MTTDSHFKIMLFTPEKKRFTFLVPKEKEDLKELLAILNRVGYIFDENKDDEFKSFLNDFGVDYEH